MTGKRTGLDGDFAEANREAGFPGNNPPGDGVYVWHHLDDFNPLTGECTMQLVRADVHNITHTGSVKQYENYTGTIYR
jgi:hypothetical protein